MSFFKFDAENASTSFELVAEGKYEVTIINAEAGLTQVGDDKLTVDFEIRSDVPQNHQGAKVLYNMFTFKHEVAVKIVNSFILACGFEHGHNFTSPQDMAQQLLGKNLKITVKHEQYEKVVDGQKQQRTAAKAKYFDPSDVAPLVSAPLNDDDLPF